MRTLLTPTMGAGLQPLRQQGDLRDVVAPAISAMNKWSLASSSAFDIPSPSKMTVRVRVCLRGGNINNGLATRSSLASAQGDWAIGFFNGSTFRPTFRVNNNGGSAQSSTTLLVDTNYLIEGCYDSTLSTANIKLFVDGVSVATGNYTTNITNNANPVYLGTYFNNGTQTIQAAYISEFEFCNRIVRNYTNYTPPSILTPDAYSTVYWRAAAYVRR